jgi:hypothetical protein
MVGGAVNTGAASIAAQLLPASEPLATILIGSEAPPAPSPINIGLMKPVLTELLPNPAGSGNDTTDEFVEIYNPNDIAFDLTDYSLQVGTSTLHSYTFAAGTPLLPHAFNIFRSSQTHFSLSNSGGQAALLDPTGATITASEAYGSAKDGQAWALADGKWYWTTMPSPGSANIIKLPTVSKSKSSASKKGPVKNAGSVKGAQVKQSNAKSTSSFSPQASSVSVSPIHTRTLALVAGLALLYAAYEYRADFANHIHQLRRNFAARRAGRKTLAWGRGNRNDE